MKDGLPENDIMFFLIFPIAHSGDDEQPFKLWGGELLAFGSANPCTEERYDSGSFATYQGRALVIVYARKAGEIRICVTGETLGSGEAIVRVVD